MIFITTINPLDTSQHDLLQKFNENIKNNDNKKTKTHDKFCDILDDELDRIGYFKKG